MVKVVIGIFQVVSSDFTPFQHFYWRDRWSLVLSHWPKGGWKKDSRLLLRWDMGVSCTGVQPAALRGTQQYYLLMRELYSFGPRSVDSLWLLQYKDKFIVFLVPLCLPPNFALSDMFLWVGRNQMAIYMGISLCWPFHLSVFVDLPCIFLVLKCYWIQLEDLIALLFLNMFAKYLDQW